MVVVSPSGAGRWLIWPPVPGRWSLIAAVDMARPPKKSVGSAALDAVAPLPAPPAKTLVLQHSFASCVPLAPPVPLENPLLVEEVCGWAAGGWERVGGWLRAVRLAADRQMVAQSLLFAACASAARFATPFLCGREAGCVFVGATAEELVRHCERVHGDVVAQKAPDAAMAALTVELAASRAREATAVSARQKEAAMLVETQRQMQQQATSLAAAADFERRPLRAVCRSRSRRFASASAA